MEKITTAESLVENYTSDARTRACTKLGFLNYTDEKFWAVREQCRIMSGEHTAISVEGDDPHRFLHVSTDDPDKVAYTKNAEKGRADIQTRTTLAAYCEKFGLQEPVVDRVVRGWQEESTAAAESNIVYCIQQLYSAIARVDELKAHLRTLLG